LVHLLTLEAQHARQARSADVDVEKANLPPQQTKLGMTGDASATNLQARLG
jgi:hypothetical protein